MIITTRYELMMNHKKWMVASSPKEVILLVSVLMPDAEGLGGGGLPGPNLRISGGDLVPVNRP
jgi:hypothetical protein